ncbi:alpha/beta hydrolase [Dankookia rubra]|uniref:Alpha/beta hydrolase n=1 Tax=Dankookia rubra TaxID=1442381 RepID=A0A4V3AA51_9PROT|nr:alpha/beta hydrolase [Dankookia rubra]TDH61755.1 alpha/beta hydrolase [Dankookia rubra]
MHRHAGLRAAFLLCALFAAPLRPATANPPPTLDWTPCASPAQSGFDCARFEVPLDHRHPEHRRLTLSVVRRPAEDPSRRIGTLFFNPGGPGGAGTRDLPAWLPLFPAPLRAAFDLISWDPRGIGDSDGIQCFPNAEAEAAFFDGIPTGSFPVGSAEQAAWITRFEAYGRLCEARNGARLAHVSTADTARDLDLLRQAVGEAKLSYLGVSYGTYLGAVYANLFPRGVRAMVLDGNVDPVAWNARGTGLSTALRLLNDIATGRTLDRFLDLCGAAGPGAGEGACAFSAGSPAATRAKFAALLDRLRQGPITAEGVSIDYAGLLAEMQGVLFTVEPRPGGFRGWAFAAGLLQALHDAPAAAPAASPPPAAAPVPEAEDPYTSPLQDLAVECAESPNPRRGAAFRRLAEFAVGRGGPVGEVLSWGDEPCSAWPARAAERYAGPWDRNPAPVLVIGNTFDPSTAYENAVAMAGLLGQARLLTVEGYGHTVLLNPSRCAAAIESAYLIEGTLPPEGTVCAQDAAPFRRGAGSGPP